MTEISLECDDLVTARCDTPSNPSVPPGIVPSLSKDDLYDLLWKQAEKELSDDHVDDVNHTDKENVIHHPSKISQSGASPFPISCSVTRDVKGLPPSAWQDVDDMQQPRERSMTPTRRIEVQPSHQPLYTEIDDVLSWDTGQQDVGERPSTGEHQTSDNSPISPLGIWKARKFRKIQPQLLKEDKPSVDGEPVYARIDKKGKRKQVKEESVSDSVPMETDQPRLIKVREITSPERQQAAVSTKLSKQSMPFRYADGGKQTAGGYADPDWVYEELSGNAEGRSDNLVTSTPRAFMSLQDVTDENCFTEEQLSLAENQWPAGPGMPHSDHPASSSMTPLHYAAAMGKRRYLLELIRGIATQTRPVLRLLSPDGKQQQVQDVSHLSCSPMNNIDCVDGHGRTALMHAVHWDQVDCARVLLHEGASVDHQTPDGSTVLHQAAFSGSPEVIDLVLHHRADPHITDAEGRSPLHWATSNPSGKALSDLLDKVVDISVNVCDGALMTPLMWAAYNTRAEHVQMLLERGADAGLVDVDGMAAVHWSIHKNEISCLKLLLTQGSSHLQDHKGKTAIHHAAEQGSSCCASLIIAVRPNSVDDVDNDGRTALHWAAACQKPEVIRAVLAGHGNPNIHDHHGCSPYDYAVTKRYHYCALLLAGQTQGVPDGPPFSHSPTAGSQRMFQFESLEHVTKPQVANEQEKKKLNTLPQADKLIKNLTVGCWMKKFTNRGRGPLHNRFFWINLSTGAICWSVNAEPSDRNVKSELLVDMRPTPSPIVAARKDYDPISRHQFAFSLLTPNRILHVVARCEDDYRLWVDGLQCLLAMGIQSAALVYKSKT